MAGRQGGLKGDGGEGKAGERGVWGGEVGLSDLLTLVGQTRESLECESEP